MGKRQRRRVKKPAGDKPRPKQRLGQAGPYMVCHVCGEALNLYSLVNPDNEWEEEPLAYVHSYEYVDAQGKVLSVDEYKRYDHEAVPVPGSPIDANTICDFCHGPSPRWVFVPRRPIRFYDPETEQLRDYSSPWTCCAGCLQAVKHRDLTKILDRVMASPDGLIATLPESARPAFRAATRLLYDGYLKSDPAGPYELKIRPNHKPAGKRTSRRGM
jgi:hypothetical protein